MLIGDNWETLAILQKPSKNLCSAFISLQVSASFMAPNIELQSALLTSLDLLQSSLLQLFSFLNSCFYWNVDNEGSNQRKASTFFCEKITDVDWNTKKKVRYI